MASSKSTEKVSKMACEALLSMPVLFDPADQELLSPEMDTEKAEEPKMSKPKAKGSSKYTRKIPSQLKISKLDTSGSIRPQKDSLNKNYLKEKRKAGHLTSATKETVQKTPQKANSQRTNQQDSSKESGCSATPVKDYARDVITESTAMTSTFFEVSRQDNLALTSQLAYSSAMSKPICLCIIWVHLKASVATEEASTEQRHRCMVKKRPKPVTQGHQIVCHHCKSGYLSYNQYLDHLKFSECGIRQQNCNKPQTQKFSNYNEKETRPSRLSCYTKISSIVGSIYSPKPIKSEMVSNSSKSQTEKCKSLPTNLPPVSCLVPNKKRKISLNESYFYNGKEPMSNKVSNPAGPRNQTMHHQDWAAMVTFQQHQQQPYYQQQQQHHQLYPKQVHPNPYHLLHQNHVAYYDALQLKTHAAYYIPQLQRFQATPVQHHQSYYYGPTYGGWKSGLQHQGCQLPLSRFQHRPEQYVQSSHFYPDVQTPSHFAYSNGSETGYPRSVPSAYVPRYAKPNDWSCYPNSSYTSRPDESHLTFNSGFNYSSSVPFMSTDHMCIPPLVPAIPSKQQYQGHHNSGLLQNCKLSHKDASVVGKRNLPSDSLNLPSIDYVGMPTDAAASTTSYHQDWSSLNVGESELNAELSEFAVERDFMLTHPANENVNNEEEQLTLTTVDVGERTEIEIVTGGSGCVDGNGLASFTHFVGSLDNLVFFNEDDICGQVLESFHIQDDLIQQAVDVSGVDQEFSISNQSVISNQENFVSGLSANDQFCLSTDATNKGGAEGVAREEEEGLHSPSSSQVYFEGEDFGSDANKKDLDEKGHCYTPANCLKEGSQDPVLTATAQLSSIRSIQKMCETNSRQNNISSHIDQNSSNFSSKNFEENNDSENEPSSTSG